ncbi:MAG: hypothetical protein WA871_02205 [Candidatus Acidiferrales bacterium]
MIKTSAIFLVLALPFPCFAAQQLAQQPSQPAAQESAQPSTLQSAPQSAPQSALQPPPQFLQPRFILEDGTPVKLALNESISSANQHKGNLVLFVVEEDVKVGEVVVIPKGANAWGTITIAKPKRKVGRAGEIEVSIDKVRLADGEKVALTNTDGGNGDSHQGQMATAIAVSGVLAWPAAPLFLLMHGKDASMPRGTETMAFVRGDNTLDPARFTPEAVAIANHLPVPVASAAESIPIAPSTPAHSATSALPPSQNLSAAPNTAPIAPEDSGPAPVPAPPSPSDAGKPR